MKQHKTFFYILKYNLNVGTNFIEELDIELNKLAEKGWLVETINVDVNKTVFVHLTRDAKLATLD